MFHKLFVTKEIFIFTLIEKFYLFYIGNDEKLEHLKIMYEIDQTF